LLAAWGAAGLASGPTTSSASARTSPSLSSRPSPPTETPGQGLQQAKDYAEILDLKFAYATNGHGIVEFDYTTGLEREIDTFPTPEKLWQRLMGPKPLAPEVADRLLTPTYNLTGKHPRYYQAIAKDQRRPGLYKEFPRDFFDLIVVDECHRGSARDDSNWREILEYFEPAYQLGMTATPKRQDNIDTYRYFGSPLYTYSLRQGIDDGFLAPYRVHRVITQ